MVKDSKDKSPYSISSVRFNINSMMTSPHARDQIAYCNERLSLILKELI